MTDDHLQAKAEAAYKERWRQAKEAGAHCDTHGGTQPRTCDACRRQVEWGREHPLSFQELEVIRRDEKRSSNVANLILAAVVVAILIWVWSQTS